MENMEIKSVDDTKPIGKLVSDYSDTQWWIGFRWGWITGVSYCSILFLIRLYRE